LHLSLGEANSSAIFVLGKVYRKLDRRIRSLIGQHEVCKVVNKAKNRETNVMLASLGVQTEVE
jgi:hypothetical protein